MRTLLIIYFKFT